MALILIVDDSKFSRGRVATALAPLGHRLVEANSGIQALERIGEQLPDLIITDLLMPDLDGLGLMSRLKEEGRPVPIIVISADIQATSRAKAAELGARAFLNKPFGADELLTLVSGMLETAEELLACR